MGTSQSNALGKKSLTEDLSFQLSEVLEQIRANESSLVDVDVPNSHIGDEGVEVGAMALTHNSYLQSINLSFNAITGRGIPFLVKGLAANNTITTLNLAGNKIGEDGCLMLGFYLSQNPAIEVLSLFHCGLNDRCAHSLVNGLVGNTKLAVLRLDMNDLTNLSVTMFAHLFAEGHNDSLAVLTLEGNKGPFDAEQRKILATHLLRAAVNYEERKAAAKYEKEQRARELRMEEEARHQQSQQEVMRRQEEEAAMAERALQQEAEELAMRERELEEAMKRQHEAKSGAQARQEALAKRQQEIDRAMASAVHWREKLNGSGVKEWRDGFTVMSTRPGDPPGSVPSLVPEAPRRLKACWCDPHDVAAPFAKTLHYHCKHEAAKQSVEEGDAPKYQGCRASGHICASVGFYAKPLPDLSAAHFFASAHPSCVDS